MVCNKKHIITVYVVLSIIKFFTARIDFQIEEGPIIVAKFYPALRNIFYGGDRCIERYNQQYIWYKEKLYVDLLHTHDFVWLYDTLIYIWWIATISFIIYLALKLLTAIYKHQFPKSSI